MRTESRLYASLLCFATLTQSFYIPGWTIQSYGDGEVIPLFVNKVYSDNTQLQYAYAELPFICPPVQELRGGHTLSGESRSLNLGEILRGDRVSLSDYRLRMNVDDEFNLLCKRDVDVASLEKAIELVRDGYVAEWIVDNLPGATRFVTTDKSRAYYASGFKMGWVDNKETEPRFFLNNHVTMVFRYTKAPGRDGDAGKKVIVGFEIYPKSVDASVTGQVRGNETVMWTGKAMELVMNGADPVNQKGPDDRTLTIPFSYSVYFREDHSLEWGNRWDMYFAADDSSRVHWFAIINSLVVLGLLTAVVAVIVARTVRGDIQAGIEGKRKSNHGGVDKGLLGQPLDLEAVEDQADEEILEDTTGWKLVHGDVFRPPAYGGILAPLVGSGAQLIFMTIGLLSLSCFGVLNPSFRGGYVSFGIGLFVFAGVFSGYYSARIYKTLGGKQWKKNVLVTGLALPGLLFLIVFILNLFAWAQASSTAIPFGSLIVILCLWLLIQLPLVYVGGWYGYNNVGAWDHPIKTNAIPRQLPKADWYIASARTILLAGIIPFGVIFIELLYVFKSLWQDKTGYYYVFGFLTVVSIVLLITVMEISIVATYVQLNAENYHWWWQSFLVGASSGIWIFLYSGWYYMTKLHVSGFVSGVLFFAYSFLACALYSLLTGTVGFLASYAFVRRIYSAIKTD
ncbi:hypothetical protein EJ05DRAFT_452150 [Pseudovirgaria hyperparasitica]|uniref:Transmembrane 9 superfamily member n=1 Tax=Pseudovirgaria hyperparasitica TaxID=470096 RepID=A0A6A6W8V4_9PEZI|nr:uncharacterized protein EJ05DRAFT_452150 [Pseudovirgaria hyperparasitica]KAF2758629.1 hypothetical protein EJ05DRAFT_452150 [Pseudovirgaria hyperparasitica]